MSSAVRNLMRKKLREEKKEQEKSQEKQVQAFEVEGETPNQNPVVGQIVQITWGDPTLIGGDTFKMPLIVTLVNDKSGRINGQMVTDPTMTGMGPGGKPVPLPPLIPIGNIPYNESRRPMTWCWVESNSEPVEAEEPEVAEVAEVTDESQPVAVEEDKTDVPEIVLK